MYYITETVSRRLIFEGNDVFHAYLYYAAYEARTGLTASVSISKEYIQPEVSGKISEEEAIEVFIKFGTYADKSAQLSIKINDTYYSRKPLKLLPCITINGMLSTVAVCGHHREVYFAHTKKNICQAVTEILLTGE